MAKKTREKKNKPEYIQERPKNTEEDDEVELDDKLEDEVELFNKTFSNETTVKKEDEYVEQDIKVKQVNLLRALPDNVKELPAKVEPEKRILILKVQCTGASGCCGGSGKNSTKSAIIHVTKTDDSWEITKNSRLYGNVMTMTKAHGLWRGSVFNMKLQEDPKFMKQLIDLELIKTGCKVVE